MRSALPGVGAITFLSMVSCQAPVSGAASVAAAGDEPCFVVSAPLERMVISCHPAPGPAACSFRVDRADDAPPVHVARLADATGHACQDQAQAFEARQRAHRACPRGTHLVGTDCVPG